MDVPRHGSKKARLIRRTAYGAAATALFPLLALGLSRMKPAAPPVDRAAVWVDSVKRGPMLRQVRGLGALVPEEVLWVPAQTDGRVEKILVRPGADVEPGAVLVVLSNPELELAAMDAEWQVKTAEANYQDLAARLHTQRLDQQAAAARAASEFATAKLNAEIERKLGDQGLTSEVRVKTTRAVADELEHRASIERQKVDSTAQSVEAQLAAQRVQLERLRAERALKRRQVAQLEVRAGSHGVLQQLGASPQAPVEVGQRLEAGAILAKIAQPSRLKAELKIPETQAKDVAVGQIAEIDTRNGIVRGRVARIDPAVQNGTVTVDVRLTGELPQGARPDLSVDGVVEIERLDDVVYVGRPVTGQPQGAVTLFKLEPGGAEASRVQVKLGRASVNAVEIVEGLKPGDQVILSDMTAHDAHNRIRLN